MSDLRNDESGVKFLGNNLMTMFVCLKGRYTFNEVYLKNTF